MARGPHLAREAVLCGPQGLFAQLISSWKGLLCIFWQTKRSKPKALQGCPTFLLVRATFTREKLLQATCIFAKIKLQTIASLLYKIGAHFGFYVGYLSLKVSEDRKKNVFAANPNKFRIPNKKAFGLDLFVCQKMQSKPFHEEINRAKRPYGPHKTASWAKCGPRATGWAALGKSFKFFYNFKKACTVIEIQKANILTYLLKILLCCRIIIVQVRRFVSIMS